MIEIISPDSYMLTDGRYDWTPKRSSEAWHQSLQDLGRILDENPGLGVALMIGLPGSGKSTWLNSMKLATESGHCAPDFDNKVIFDSTGVSRARRKRVITVAKSRKRSCIALVMQTPEHIAMQRNAERPEHRRVPYHTFNSMCCSFKKEPVILEEGFHTIYAVGGE